MVHPYLRRRAGVEPVVYPHACLEPVLAKTLGVPLFQEQVIRLAMVAADYTPGEADQLRRDMAAWRKSGRIERHRERLTSRMTAKGIAPEFAARVFEQIRGFGEYGFPESHAASFALIAYATAWMRRRHPEVFTCGLLNAQPMGFYSPSTILEDAKRHGVVILPVDVARSDWDCALEGDVFQTPVLGTPSPDLRTQGVPKTPVWKTSPLRVRMGLRYVKGLASNVGERILEAREVRSFLSIPDLVARARLDEGSVSRLADSGALAPLEPRRRAAVWAAKGAAKVARSPGRDLPSEEPVPTFRDLDLHETIGWDYAATGHSASGHPLLPLRPLLRAKRLPEAKEVLALPNGRRAHYAGLVICRQRPGTASGVVFLTLEDETGFVNVVVWAKVYEKFRVLLRTASFLGVSGKLQVEDGVTHLIAESLWVPKLPALERAPAEVDSHDFH
jgi:error-prone DNA polymerase